MNFSLMSIKILDMRSISLSIIFHPAMKTWIGNDLSFQIRMKEILRDPLKGKKL